MTSSERRVWGASLESIKIVGAGIAEKLSAAYPNGGRCDEHVPARGRRAHRRLMEAAFGAPKQRLYSVAYDINRREDTLERIHHSMAGFLIERIGKVMSIEFKDLPMPVSFEAAVLSRNDGVVVRMVTSYDHTRDVMTCRADISVSVVQA